MKKKHPLDDRTEFSSPDLIDGPLGRMSEICRADFFDKRLDTDASAAFCMLADSAIRVIDRGWSDWDNHHRFDTFVGAMIGFAKSMGRKAADWLALGEELKAAGVAFWARVEKTKATRSAKRKTARRRLQGVKRAGK